MLGHQGFGRRAEEEGEDEEVGRGRREYAISPSSDSPMSSSSDS